jgi:hypothetical protein
MWTIGVLGLVIAGWLALYLYWSWGMRGGVALPPDEDVPARGLPKVSVLVAARNEQAKLGEDIPESGARNCGTLGNPRLWSRLSELGWPTSGAARDK